jgi:hypothetical protein
MDYLLKTRKEYYVRRQRECSPKKGDRVAVLGRGIAVVEQVDDKEASVVLWNRLVLRIGVGSEAPGRELGGCIPLHGV